MLDTECAKNINSCIESCIIFFKIYACFLDIKKPFDSVDRDFFYIDRISRVEVEVTRVALIIRFNDIVIAFLELETERKVRGTAQTQTCPLDIER